MEGRKVFSLQQICAAVKKSIDDSTQGHSFWVKAEIAGVNAQRHVYLELVQHQEGTRVAVMRGIIWQHRMRGIRAALGDELPNILREGAEVLFQATVQYNALYGLSLHIEDVDLSYSLGELERRKKATMESLRTEGLFDMNRALPEALVVQRIALITSLGSAAYSDFMKHLVSNEYGYVFHVQVFASSVQGDSAPLDLRTALAHIDPARFDAVVIIRGGGSKLDLEAFNDLELCRAIARLPIPVMTGIGHDVDVSVVDMIAKSPHKTPTAVADHLIDKCLYFETSLNGFLVGIQRVIAETFSERKERISSYAELLRQRPISFCQLQRGSLQSGVGQFARTATEQLLLLGKRIDQHAHTLSAVSMRRVKQVEEPRLREMRLALDQAAQHGLRALIDRVNGIRDAIELLDPDRIMARGFSITRNNGRLITDPATLHAGDTIETTFARGSIRSTVNAIEHNG